MASTSSLLNFLSPLFPSTTTNTTTNTTTPKFPPQTSSSSTLLSITPSSSQTQQQIKPISAKNDEYMYQGDVMAVVCPSLAYSNTLFFNSSNYNIQIFVDEKEPEERLLGRFRREVMRTGVIQECRRRRQHENTHDKVKRKFREACKRNSRSRRRGPPPRFQNREEPTMVEKNDEDDGDNWEVPEGDSPF